MKEKKLWQLICGNGIAEMGGKKIVAICGNIVAEMEGGKNCGNWFVAMELPKWEEKKKNYGNGVTENWRGKRERERENCPNKNIYIFGGVNHLTSSSWFLFSKYFKIYSLIIPNKI